MPPALVPVAVAVGSSLAAVVAARALTPAPPTSPQPEAQPAPPPPLEVLEGGTEKQEDITEALALEQIEKRRQALRQQEVRTRQPSRLTNVNQPRSLLGE